MTFDSVYQITNPLSNLLRGTRFWDYFDGQQARNWWNLTTVTAVPTLTPDDNLNAGFLLSVPASGFGLIGFANLARHYDPKGMRSIWIARRNSSPAQFWVGTANLLTGGSGARNCVWINLTSDTFYRILTDNGATTLVDSSTPIDQLFHVLELTLQESFVVGTIDGIDNTTKTTDIPDLPQQPISLVEGFGGAANHNLRYCEVMDL